MRSKHVALSYDVKLELLPWERTTSVATAARLPWGVEDGAADCQSHPNAVGLGRVERQEDTVATLGRIPRWPLHGERSRRSPEMGSVLIDSSRGGYRSSSRLGSHLERDSILPVAAGPDGPNRKHSVCVSGFQQYVTFGDLASHHERHHFLDRLVQIDRFILRRGLLGLIGWARRYSRRVRHPPPSARVLSTRTPGTAPSSWSRALISTAMTPLHLFPLSIPRSSNVASLDTFSLGKLSETTIATADTTAKMANPVVKPCSSG